MQIGKWIVNVYKITGHIILKIKWNPTFPLGKIVYRQKKSSTNWQQMGQFWVQKCCRTGQDQLLSNPNTNKKTDSKFHDNSTPDDLRTQEDEGKPSSRWNTTLFIHLQESVKCSLEIEAIICLWKDYHHLLGRNLIFWLYNLKWRGTLCPISQETKSEEAPM